MGDTDWGEMVLFWWVAQYMFNPIFCWWVGLRSHPVVWLEATLRWRKWGSRASSKGPVHALPRSVPLVPQQASTIPRLRRRLLDTHGKSGSVLWGHCSFLLGPGAHKVLFVPSQSLFLQSCVSSGGSVVGLMVTSSKRACVIPRVCCTQSPGPAASTADLYLLRKPSNAVLAQPLWGLWVLVRTRFVWVLCALLTVKSLEPALSWVHRRWHLWNGKLQLGLFSAQNTMTQHHWPL